MRIDLHTHSSRSDGTGTPADVVREAAAAGLDVVALTDHDTTAGWQEAGRAARSAGIVLVPGVEVSTRVDGIGVHVLGYLVDPDHEPLAAEFRAARESRTTRAQRMVELIARDHPLTWDDVRAQTAPGATVGRPHIADALVRRGVVPDRGAAFADILATGGRYHVGHYAPDPVRATRLIREAGGVPVMAHPLAAARGEVVPERVIADMAAAGLAALEADHRDHTPAQRRRARELAAELGLLVTGSSDYHGTGKPNRLGENRTDPQVYAALVAQATSGVRPVG